MLLSVIVLCEALVAVKALVGVLLEVHGFDMPVEPRLQHLATDVALTWIRNNVKFFKREIWGCSPFKKFYISRGRNEKVDLDDPYM